MNRFEFFDRIPAMPQRQRQKIQWAYFLAKKLHEKQERDDGTRYFEHVRGVAEILIKHGYATAEYMVLAILHDGPEDTHVPISMLEQLFGPRVAREILTLSKSYGLEDLLTGFITPTPKRELPQYFEGIMRGGKRTCIVKCADRIHNLSDLINPPTGSRWTPEKRLRQVTETREWILPLSVHDARFTEQLNFLCDLIQANVNNSLKSKSH